MSAMLSSQDRDMLNYMTDLQVRLGRRGEMIYPGKRERAGLLERDFTLRLYFVPAGGGAHRAQWLPQDHVVFPEEPLFPE